MSGMPHMAFLRSESIFGLSFVIMIFDDSSVNDWNRQKVLERLTQVDLPNGQNLQPQIGTDWGLTGQIYWYTIRSTNPRYDLMELRSLEDWVLLKQFKSVLNVVDVSDFGGKEREYQVRIDPSKLVSYGLTIGQVEQQLSNNNNNAGGGFVELGTQQMNVRALGLYKNVQDIENTVLTTKNGTALSRVGRNITRNDQHHHTEDIISIRASLMDWNWKNGVPLFTVHERKFHERTHQETFHLVESMASLSLKLGSGLGTGCGELGRLFFGVEPMSAFIDSAIRFVFASALSTLTFTICPALTASDGSLMKRLESSLMCTRPS